MNKRIEELKGKALDQAVPYTWHHLNHVQMDDVLNKFAELLVNECADKCLEMAYVNPGPHHYAAMIKAYFGIE